jgi:DNA-directed DNA polymerase III PolC
MKHRKSLALPTLPESQARRVDFFELLARSNFSFLQGASHPEELVLRAKKLGYAGLGLCDVNGLYGVVRGFRATEKPSNFDVEELAAEHALENALKNAPEGTAKFRYICGTELTPFDASPLVLLPMNKSGYIRICHLLTKARRQSPKGHVTLSLQDILAADEDLIVFPLPPWKESELKRIQDVFQDRVYLPVCKDLSWQSVRLYRDALEFEEKLGLPLFATTRALFHDPSRKPLHDVLTCILHQTTLDQIATRLTLNRERYLKAPEDIFKLFHDRPDMMARTLEIAKRVEFSLNELRYRYPEGNLPSGKSATGYLRELVEKGILWRYPLSLCDQPFMAKVHKQVETELKLIQKLEYEDYFLTLWEICQFAIRENILHQGRGSASNSIVCYTLGLTNVDPISLGLLFERFLSAERGEPPDIDIDFEHERREEVIQYIYRKYGAEHAAMVCTVITYRSRMAIREVAKAMGIQLPQVAALVKFMGREGLSHLVEATSEKGLETPIQRPQRPHFDPSSRSIIAGKPREMPPKSGEVLDLARIGLDEEKFHKLLCLALEMQGFPRHLGIHSGGFVISQEPLINIVPVEAASMKDRYVIQWNKDDIDTLKMMKVDFLSLGMLSAVKKSLDLLARHKNIDWNLAQVPQDDSETYKMIQRADTIGVFQIESRAQIALLPRLKPKNYYDLVIEVAIVRPGPIQGGMVHPYLKRRAGLEKITYAHPKLEPILKKTLGIPLFQEQVMQIAVVAAGFTPGEADELRRVVSSAWKKISVMKGLRERVISGMFANGIGKEYAEQIYKTIEGFASYGFPESHAASFALITYVSCYLKCHHPEVFTCALLNSQPMGFYPARQLISDAQRHSVVFHPLDVQHSQWDYTLEALGLRVGFRSIYGVREEHVQLLVAERDRAGHFCNLEDLIRRTGLPRTTLVRLAGAGALNSLGHNPRQMLWILQGMSFDPQSLFFGSAKSQGPEEESTFIPGESSWEHVQREYLTKGFSIESHPLAVLRPQLSRYTTAKQLESLKHRTPLRVAGLKSLLQKPPTAKGMCFISMEDETGIMNIVITPDIYQNCRLVLQQTPLLDIEGYLESQNGVRNIRARVVRPLQPVDDRSITHHATRS